MSRRIKLPPLLVQSLQFYNEMHKIYISFTHKVRGSDYTSALEEKTIPMDIW